VGNAPKRVLIEESLPAAAIGVECMRQRGSLSALAARLARTVWAGPATRLGGSTPRR
jgi:hypothetical protein